MKCMKTHILSLVLNFHLEFLPHAAFLVLGLQPAATKEEEDQDLQVLLGASLSRGTGTPRCGLGLSGVQVECRDLRVVVICGGAGRVCEHGGSGEDMGFTDTRFGLGPSRWCRYSGRSRGAGRESRLGKQRGGGSAEEPSFSIHLWWIPG